MLRNVIVLVVVWNLDEWGKKLPIYFASVLKAGSQLLQFLGLGFETSYCLGQAWFGGRFSNGFRILFRPQQATDYREVVGGSDAGFERVNVKLALCIADAKSGMTSINAAIHDGPG